MQGEERRVQDAGCRVQGAGCRVHGVPIVPDAVSPLPPPGGPATPGEGFEVEAFRGSDLGFSKNIQGF